MCDTLGVYKTKTFNGQNLIGKNSDRPVGEAQPLVFVPATHNADGTTVRCTHLTLPQTEKTYAVIGSQPDWIWGFEMGVNEHGLFIGNEAEDSRNVETDTGGLLGMDMLRLALERSQTCREAIDVLNALLKTYGQNANASLTYEHRYESTFMLCDRTEMWIMETAGREWVARQITEYAAASNCYTIRTEFDLSSQALLQTAIDNKWQNPMQTFDFAKAYTLPSSRQTHAAGRYHRMMDLLSHCDHYDFAALKGIFRDHMEGTVEEARFGAEAGHFYTLCMHPMTWQSPKTAASLLMTYDDVLGVVMRHAFSTPCTSIYMPVYFTGYLPTTMQRGGRQFDEQSLWWCMERVMLAVSTDAASYKEYVTDKLYSAEALIESQRADIEAQAKEYIKSGQRDEGYKLLNDYMTESAELIRQTANDVYQSIAAKLQGSDNFYGPCRELILWFQSHCGLYL